jgi:hypothetical protein
VIIKTFFIKRQLIILKKKKVVARLKNVFYKPKKQSQYFEVLFERVLVNEIKNSFKIVGCKNKTHIRRGMFDGFFSHDIIEAHCRFIVP